MIAWLANQKIGKKLAILGVMVTALILMNIVGMIEIAKTGYFQFLEREHIEFALLMQIKLDQIQETLHHTDKLVNTSLVTANSTERLEMGLQTLLANTLELPIACLDAVNDIEKSAFTLLGFGEVFTLCENDIVDLNEANEIVENYVNQRISSAFFVDRFQDYLNTIQKNSRRFSILVPEARNVVQSLVLIATTILSFIVLALFLLISNLLRTPIVAMSARIKDIARGEGDLTRRLKITSHDEIGEVAHWFNLFIERLQGVMIDVKSVTGHVADGSYGMSARAAAMSEGANSQAAAAQQVSSSMKEITATIRKNTENAQQTEQLALQAAADATDTGQAVAEAVLAMQQIAQKISMIEDITRQTRMLSLNASIEAVQAQVSGKGFAVVASEVRALAERSQAAATEITNLAQSSVRVAENAGAMLRRLVPDIQKTAELVQEISAVSKEQNTSTEQINWAIEQLNRITQQNALTSKELATIAKDLSTQSEELQQTIAFFNTEGITQQRYYRQ
ncbi:methyl-accepting chemotaxis protein [Roseofilum capinflatum]|uniref:Methyl-accepting chemotaxis protein n=1 Tax=Roseofilum capinflatum BLCC-M114 TaxID=3022440 RepID=A0ABT7BAE0_9CYAN|nr:methyl-accepting chemotaxis protein [Roseofilum capinflatum]MDJ1176116.1 methyl-accepting chemotaxis protein [Roseofilum capinflatum BLCC-M114]